LGHPENLLGDGWYGKNGYLTLSCAIPSVSAGEPVGMRLAYWSPYDVFLTVSFHGGKEFSRKKE
jgi:hypothetical protein